MTYNGMKWLKCDLHMHTPFDSINWRGTTTSQDMQETASQYAQACLDAELDVIAITDHNFISKDFVPVLQGEFKKRAREGQKQVTVFPGFEFEANVGRGVHVLALFPSETTGEVIDAALTECGVGVPREKEGIFEKSTKSLSAILDVVQRQHGGIVILPHCKSNDGIFDNDSISEWLQQDQYKNPELLAVEVPCPVSQMSTGFQKLFKSGNDCDRAWKRIRPIATIMSSDCKQLRVVDAELNPEPNSIGYRFSWIKMSAPSIESLRQAFLDQESRIILPQDNKDIISPEKKNRIARIKALHIQNALFIDNQEIMFSPNLNTLIGGRGCGKSTIIEYLRILLKRTRELDANTEQKVSRIKGTITSATSLSVTIENADGVTDTIELTGNNYLVKERDLADEETFFNQIPVTFFSQQQITHLTDCINKNGEDSHLQTKQLLDLIDGFVKNGLIDLQQQETSAIRALNDSFALQTKIRNTQNDQKIFEQELAELERQWKAHHEIEADAKKHKALATEKRLWNDIEKSVHAVESAYTTALENIGNNFISVGDDELPHKDLLNTIQQKIQKNQEVLQKTVHSALTQFVQDFESIQDDSWRAMKTDIDNADSVFQQACEALGLSPDAVGHLRNISDAMEKKKSEIAECKKTIEQLSTGAELPHVVLEKLHKIWHEQYVLRCEAATQGNNLAKLDGQDAPFIKIEVDYSADYSSFSEKWKAFSPQDRRIKLGRAWDDIGERLFNTFRSSSNAYSPWNLLATDLGKQLVNIAKELQCDSQELYQHIANNIDRWHTLLTSRIQDAVDITLYRTDGSEAGCISKGSLSDGQRNTAALVLLLSQKGGPLIIDQPEDELDSNFVYKELIPMLRRVKTTRQIIVATHNANLPVNGDAELVYALEARNGHGAILTQGGLDNQKVTQAVLDIMEGSEEAFRKRREKYNF